MKIHEIQSQDLKADLLNRIKSSSLRFSRFHLKSGAEKIIVAWEKRFFVVVDVSGVRMPFYLSSGLGGKASVPSGKWYPFFGIGSDGWINKAGEQNIITYYSSPKLKSVSQELDKVLGDLRLHWDLFPTVGYDVVAPTVNQDMDPVSHGEKGASDNIIHVLRRIGDVF
jgi:hypothetical protein